MIRIMKCFSLKAGLRATIWIIDRIPKTGRFNPGSTRLRLIYDDEFSSKLEADSSFIYAI